jgi:hypothetical protein
MEIFPDQTQCEHAQNDPEYLGLKIKKTEYLGLLLAFIFVLQSGIYSILQIL